MAQRLPNRHVLQVCLGPALLGEARNQPVTFIGPKPANVAGPIWQYEKRRDPKRNGGNTLKRKKPTPSGKAKPVNTQDGSRNRPADDKPDRDGGHEPRDRFGSVLIDKPVGKVNNHARKEACFRRTKEETRPVKLG